MGKFLWESFILFLIITLLYYLMAIIVNPKEELSNDYMAAMIDKHERINQLNEPKIIFAGGSNLAFGLNSEEIEKEFLVPVVNLGLHGGLGLDYILKELKYSISSGDVVFISVEYFLGSKGNYKLKKNSSKHFKEAYKYYNINIKKEIDIHIGETRNNIYNYELNKKEEVEVAHRIKIYSREAFNKYGDVIAHLDKKPAKELRDRFVKKYRYWEGIKELNKFYKYAISKNVNVFYIYPNYPLSEYEKYQNAIEKYGNDLTDNLSFEILNTPRDFVFEDDLFFDTVYHLNKKGREKRTKKLIELIKKSTKAQQCINAIRDYLHKLNSGSLINDVTVK